MAQVLRVMLPLPVTKALTTYLKNFTAACESTISATQALQGSFIYISSHSPHLGPLTAAGHQVYEISWQLCDWPRK